MIISTLRKWKLTSNSLYIAGFVSIAAADPRLLHGCDGVGVPMRRDREHGTGRGHRRGVGRCGRLGRASPLGCSSLVAFDRAPLPM